MRDPKIAWERNLQNIKDLHALHWHFLSMLTSMDLSDILRSEYVLLVSAFDCYIHDVALYGMTEIFSQKKKRNNHYDDFRIPMSMFEEIISENDVSMRIEKYKSSIKKILANDSFQSPQNIEYALGLVSYKKIWTELSKTKGVSAEDIRKEMSMIVHRRNVIAHEADIKDLMSLDKNPIDRQDVENVISFLSDIVNCVEDLRHNTP